MIYHGHVSDGIIHLADGVTLPEGAAVIVEPVDEFPGRCLDAPGDAIYRLGELAAETGVHDLAENVDHYLYGHPKSEP